MTIRPRAAFALATMLAAAAGDSPMCAAEPALTIAHRGASGYLPEHTLPAVAMAHAMGADYIEQDLVLTRDRIPVVLHDIHLDTVTDVRTVFPGRSRDDGRFYAVDFTLAELRRLRVHERVDHRTGKAVFPGRFPTDRGRFSIPTLEEEIELIQGLNISRGKSVGIYPEIKAAAWHRDQGFDISRIVQAVLTRHGYTRRTDPVFLQCFDAGELRRWRDELKSDLRLVLLCSKPLSSEQLATTAEYADAIGPSISLLVTQNPDGSTPLTQLAHNHRLAVHAWTIRRDQLPKGFATVDTLHEDLFHTHGVDAAFTDFPDLTAAWLSAHPASSATARPGN